MISNNDYVGESDFTHLDLNQGDLSGPILYLINIHFSTGSENVSTIVSVNFIQFIWVHGGNSN